MIWLDLLIFRRHTILGPVPKVQESIQGCTSLMSAVRYPPLAVFLIAPEHSTSEGMSTRYCDWEEGGLGC